MAKTEDLKNALSPAKQKQNKVVATINSMNKMMREALPAWITPERMIRVCLTNFRLNPKLFNCEEGSIVGAVIQSAQLGLEPILGNAYLIPYGDQCQFQIGYKGMITLFYRSANAKSLEAREVYQNDEFDYCYGLESMLTHKPASGDRGDLKGFYAIAKLTTGVNAFEYMSVEDMDIYAKKYSQAYRKGWTSPWATDFIPMGKKTVIKKVLKYMPLSVEMQHALSSDETVKKYNHTTEDMFDVNPEDLIIDKDEDGKVEVKETISSAVKKTTKKKTPKMDKEKIEEAKTTESKEGYAEHDKTTLTIDDKFKIIVDEGRIDDETLLRFCNEMAIADKTNTKDAEIILSGPLYSDFREKVVTEGKYLSALRNMKK